MTLEDTIDAYYMPLYHKDPDIVDYYYSIFEAINCTTWQATVTKSNLLAANWQACQPLAGWNGFAVMLPGA